MRITTQMLNQTAASTGIAVNSVSLVNYLDTDTDTTSLLDGLQTSTSQIKAYEELEEAASSLESTVKIFTDDSDDNLFVQAQESGDNSKIIENVQTLADQYNEILKGLENNTSAINSYYLQALKNLASDNSEALGALGISISGDGSLTLNKSVLEDASTEEIEKVFGSDSVFMQRLEYLTSKVSTSAAAAVESTASQYTGNAAVTSSYTNSKYSWWG